MIRVEHDDGKSEKFPDKLPMTTRRGRARGFYAIGSDGVEHQIPISFMRVGEMRKMEKFLRIFTAQ